LKTGKCKYGAACKFHHPKDIQIQLSDDLSRTVEQTQTNSSVFDGAIGDTQSIMPLISPLSHNSKGLPVRPVLIFSLSSLVFIHCFIIAKTQPKHRLSLVFHGTNLC